MKRIIVAVFIFSLALVAPRAWAINGAQVTGFTATQEALGGTGVSFPQDVGIILSNPAGLGELPLTFNINALTIFPKLKINSTAVPVNSLLGISPGNIGSGTQTHQSDAVFLPSAAFVMPLPFFDNRVSIGFGLFITAGFAVDFRDSRFNPNLLGSGGSYDDYSYFGLIKLPFAVSYKINDQLSLGMGLHVDRYQFASNTSTGPAGLFVETGGANKFDQPWGWNYSVGLLYKPYDFLSVGVSYTSEQYMQDFERYRDILPDGLNYPQQLNVGLTLKPIEKLAISGEFRWINWGGVDGALGNSTAKGGFGWVDQYVAMLGVQYEATPMLTLRAGYNYGRSAVPSEAIFVNQLTNVINEHHISCGSRLRLFEHFEISIAYTYTPTNKVHDTGLGTSGAWTELSVNQINAELGFQF